MPNQTKNGLPEAALVNGDQGNGGVLSYLPGQRLSRCTCAEDADMHPGPKHSDGTFVGRSAPEIDVFEAQARYIHQRICCQLCQRSPSDHETDWAGFAVSAVRCTSLLFYASI